MEGDNWLLGSNRPSLLIAYAAIPDMQNDKLKFRIDCLSHLLENFRRKGHKETISR